MIRALPLIAAVICLSIILFGCGAAPPERVVPQTANVPVPVHCKTTVETKVVYPDTDDALRTAANIFDRTKLLVAGRDIRTARILELETALKGCE